MKLVATREPKKAEVDSSMSSTNRTIDKVDIDTVVALQLQMHDLKRKLKKNTQKSHKQECSLRKKTRIKPSHSLSVQNDDFSSSDSDKIKSSDGRKRPVRSSGKGSKDDWSETPGSMRHIF